MAKAKKWRYISWMFPLIAVWVFAYLEHLYDIYSKWFMIPWFLTWFVGFYLLVVFAVYTFLEDK